LPRRNVQAELHNKVVGEVSLNLKSTSDSSSIDLRHRPVVQRQNFLKNIHTIVCTFDAAVLRLQQSMNQKTGAGTCAEWSWVSSAPLHRF
jgi:hypothetical protein